MKAKSENQVERLIRLAGGSAELARLCGVDPAGPTRWKKGRGVVPAWHHQTILENAKKKGLPITAADFFAAPSAPKRAGALAAS